MIVSHLALRNWKNFRAVDVPLRSRVFLAGPNASGKSNFLDVFQFLRDIAKVKQGGGLQKAVRDRGDFAKIRCLAAPRETDIEIEVHLARTAEEKPSWKYAIGIAQRPSATASPSLVYERIWNGKRRILNRPDKSDEKDPMRLTRTHLEQISMNERFRELAGFFESVSYQHLVPQLLRYPEAFSRRELPEDPYGRGFLRRVADTPERIRRSRLHRIEQILKIAVPQLKHLEFRDEAGIPHLEAVYEHWKPMEIRQQEDQFSDGTLRLIALFWSLQEGEGMLLLEEPELSLNTAIIRALPSMIYRLQRRPKSARRIERSDRYYPSLVPVRTPQQERQVVISTHSADLLSDQGIGGEEKLILTPTNEGTKVEVASTIQKVRVLLENGFTPAEAVIRRTEPQETHAPRNHVEEGMGNSGYGPIISFARTRGSKNDAI